LRYGQSIDAIVFGVAADELHESDLPAKIECSMFPAREQARCHMISFAGPLFTALR
jgi:hypothetical protein